MTKIHMETEEVRETARLLDRTAGDLYFMPSKLKNLASSISGAWQGGRSDHYAREIYRQAEILQREVSNLQRLAVQVGNEVNEWENADNNGARTITKIDGSIWPEVGGLAPLFPATMFFQNLPLVNGYPAANGETSLINDWEAGIDVTFSDKWTKSSGWQEDTDSEMAVKINLIDGAYAEGDGSSNWQLGQYDIGGAIGQYGISQGEAGVKFGVDENGFMAGAYGEYDLAEVSGAAVLGSSLLGLTISAGGSAGSADGFIGMKHLKDGRPTVGASVGVSAVAGEVGLGVNIAGANVGVKAGAALGFELGIKLGAETEIKAGPFKIGLSFGKAITD